MPPRIVGLWPSNHVKIWGGGRYATHQPEGDGRSPTHQDIGAGILWYKQKPKKSSRSILCSTCSRCLRHPRQPYTMTQTEPASDNRTDSKPFFNQSRFYSKPVLHMYTVRTKSVLLQSKGVSRTKLKHNKHI